MLGAALRYARKGYPVFPLNGKVPAIKGGHGCLDATTDEAKIIEWWQGNFADCNIGLALGKQSGVWALDVDNDKGGRESLERLEHEHGPLPDTVRQITGNGMHYFFRLNGEDISNSVSQLGPGLDVRSEGGYVVVAPSIHPDTRTPYRWVDGHSPFEQGGA